MLILRSAGTFLWAYSKESLHHLEWRKYGYVVCGFLVLAPTLDGALTSGAIWYYGSRIIGLIRAAYVRNKERKGG